MNIAILGAGAAGMICGSCLRDNTLAIALRRLGHEVTLVPLYTPMRTEQPSAAIRQVFYGGVNVWLQFASGVFRKTPRFVDWLFDRPWLLNWAGQYGAQTNPSQLADFTMAVLRGDHGPVTKELHRLADFLSGLEKPPEIIMLPNALLIGLAALLKRQLGCRVVCELTGEDIFLEAMDESQRKAMREAIRQREKHVDLFVATSRYYAGHMAEYLGIPAERIAVVLSGVPEKHMRPVLPAEPPQRPPTIGYLARICPEKGADRAIDVFRRVKVRPGMEQAKLRIAGYLGRAHEKWWTGIWARAQRDETAGDIEFLGEVELGTKLSFLDSIDVLCVPTRYAEAKGIYVVEALGHGVPAVLPAHGSFVEMAEMTGGVDLFAADNLEEAADRVAGLLQDTERRRRMGESCWRVSKEKLTDTRMAEEFVRRVMEIETCR
ncbi:MAG: glycosyltransferase family 4 protein [Tepidisphaerales bacterium]